jgi:hypothetical protein
LTYEVKNPHQNTGYSGVVLLGTSQTHWWSNPRCVALERIGDVIALHDLGLGLGGTSRWVRYPILPTDGFGRPNRELLDTTLLDGNHFANELGAAMGDLLVDKLMTTRVCAYAQRIAELAGLPEDQRLQQATQTAQSMTVESVEDKKSMDGRWLLSSSKPHLRVYVTAAPDDIAEVEERLSRLVGS